MDRDTSQALAAAIGQAVAAALGPTLERLSADVRRVEHRVAQFVPRRTITDGTKARHRAVVQHLGGRCPCCGVEPLVDTAGNVLGEYDHFYSRERRDFEDTWLICKPCHRSMKDRHDRTIEFQSYQRRASAFEEGQLPLLIVN